MSQEDFIQIQIEVLEEISKQLKRIADTLDKVESNGVIMIAKAG